MFNDSDSLQVWGLKLGFGASVLSAQYAALWQLRTVYYWTLVLGQVAAAMSSTTKNQPLFGDGSALRSSLSCTLWSFGEFDEWLSSQQLEVDMDCQITC